MQHDSETAGFSEGHPETWLALLSLNGRRASTLLIYRRDIARFEKYLQRPLTSASRADAMTFVAQLRHTMSAGSVAMIVRSVRAFYSWCVGEGAMENNPFARLRLVAEATLQQIPGDDDVTAILRRAAKHRRDLSILTVLADTGCRKHEAAALEVDDVDLASGVVRFPVSKSKPRLVPLSDRAQAALAAWIRVRPNDSGVSLWGVGDPYTLIGKVTQKYSNRQYSPHDLRRAFAVRWLAGGGSEIGLMRIAGWKSRDMIALYTEARADELAHDEMRRVLGPR